MNNWIKTTMSNVSVSWDADAKKATISHRYEVDEDGEPVEELDAEEMQRACQAALDGIGVHVLLTINENADAGEVSSEGYAEAVMYPAIDETWVPTHKITFTPQGGEPEVTFVMLCEEDAAYDRDEWRAEEGAAWGISEHGPNVGYGNGWYCEGQVTPGGQNGEVEVEALEVPVDEAGHDDPENGCPCDVCTGNDFAPSTEDAAGLFAEPDAYALACAKSEIESHDDSDARKEWSEEACWEDEAAEWTRIDPKDLEGLRAWHSLLPDGVFEDFLGQAREKFKTRFCSIMAKHYAWVLS